MPSPGSEEDTLRVEVRHRGGAAVVEVHGELDAAGAPLVGAVVEHVAARAGTPVAVDLRAVPFADTHGLAPVLGRDVVLVAASAPVRRLLRLMGLPDVRGLPPVLRRRRDRSRLVGAVR
ncbi:anti-sigma B factor antagonist [Geodermatophilus dictyosporus]|uniref:Anti-sigma B factor antagonist n=1 Tax=Geodermatophilus dictyosporus TaxID=1523247 RepID=A0A1I5PKU4_9ACTN|nr:anti-sigma B factor antagonist [Geodermatophilus dictyosporus]